MIESKEAKMKNIIIVALLAFLITLGFAMNARAESIVGAIKLAIEKVKIEKVSKVKSVKKNSTASNTASVSDNQPVESPTISANEQLNKDFQRSQLDNQRKFSTVKGNERQNNVHSQTLADEPTPLKSGTHKRLDDSTKYEVVRAVDKEKYSILDKKVLKKQETVSTNALVNGAKKFSPVNSVVGGKVEKINVAVPGPTNKIERFKLIGG